MPLVQNLFHLFLLLLEQSTQLLSVTLLKLKDQRYLLIALLPMLLILILKFSLIQILQIGLLLFAVCLLLLLFALSFLRCVCCSGE